LRASQVVLIVGAVLCAAAAFGPIWLVRAGAGVAVITGVVAVVLAFRHIQAARSEHAARIVRLTKDQSALLSKERRRNAEVIDVLTERATSATERAEQQQVKITELTVTAGRLSSENTTLRSAVKAREATIAQVRETLRTRDAEIGMLRDDLARATTADDVQDLRQAG
jgi:chromosome segregation ATPase